MSLRLRLRLGVILLAVVCLGGTALIVRNLNFLRRNQDVFVFKDTLFHMHHHALEKIQTAQAHLYKHKAGYSRNIDGLVAEIVAFDSLLMSIPKSYREYPHPEYCTSCHDSLADDVARLEARMEDLGVKINEYQGHISILITTSDPQAQIVHHDHANALGEDIIQTISSINTSAGFMVNQLLAANTRLAGETIFTVTAVVAFVVLLALVIMGYTHYSINRLMTSLLRGTESIYRDDFSLRLPDTGGQDEYSLLAARFNLMAEHLHDRDLEIQQKAEELSRANVQLRDLNENLEARIGERTTELENMVDRLQETTSALGESKRRLEAANIDLLKANQAKSNFLSIVSHELKTPLSVINGFLSLILDERYRQDPQQLREAVEISKRRGQQLTRMIDELIDLSRLDAKAMVIHREEVAVESALLDVVEQFQEDLQRKQIKLNTSSCGRRIFCDPDKIKQVFTNLIGNAIKFSPEGSTIDLECREDDASFHFLCRDRGIGIPEQEQEKIFEKFHQVDSSATRHYGGAGLGLSIVKEIVALHGGKVWAESEPGKGCTFHFTLPGTGAPDGSDPGDSSRTFPRAELT
jgi:signal transduction histidine kinase